MQSTGHQSKPNIVVILVDDMGYSDLGCFGSEIATPHLDGLAATGVRFTQMYNCARCCPTRAALLTGLYPHQAGVGSMVNNDGVPAYQGYLRDDCVTMAEALRGAGYRTLMSGKWHVGGSYAVHLPEQWLRDAGTPGYPLPTQRGFDHFYGTLAGAGSYFHPPTLMQDDEFIMEVEDDYYLTDAISDEAAGMIRTSLDEDPQRPFFLYLAYTAPHWPLHARPEDIEKYRGRYDAGWDELREQRTQRLRDMGVLDGKWELSPRDPDSRPWANAEHKQWESLRMAVYAAQVEAMDRGVGTVVETLRQRGVLDNTLILFLSDNGGCAEFLREDGKRGTWPEFYSVAEGRARCAVGNVPNREPGPAHTFMSYDLPWANASNAPFRLFKSWAHEGGISTPLIAHWPAGLPAGTIRHTPAHVVDVMATALEAATASYPETYNAHAIQPTEGISMLAALRGEAVERHTPLYWEHIGNRAIRDGKWKLVWDRRAQVWELYDIDADRTELHDLSAQHLDIVARLASDWNQWAQRCGVLPKPWN